MGIEFLENAARAAGFAMAVDEPAVDTAKVAGEGDLWRPGTVPMHGEDFQDKLGDKSSFSDWVKGMVGANGRDAPA